MGQSIIKYQQIYYTIENAGQQIIIDVETDKLYKRLTGINIVLSDKNNKFSTIELEVNNTEVFPEKFEILRLLFREEVPFGFDYHELDEPAKGSKVKGKYIDVNTGGNYPYNLIISLRLENEKEIKPDERP